MNKILTFVWKITCAPTPMPTHPSANPLTPERWREDKRGWEHRHWSNFNFVPYGTILFLELKTKNSKQTRQNNLILCVVPGLGFYVNRFLCIYRICSVASSTQSASECLKYSDNWHGKFWAPRIKHPSVFISLRTSQVLPVEEKGITQGCPLINICITVPFTPVFSFHSPHCSALSCQWGP